LESEGKPKRIKKRRKGKKKKLAGPTAHKVEDAIAGNRAGGSCEKEKNGQVGWEGP